MQANGPPEDKTAEHPKPIKSKKSKKLTSTPEKYLARARIRSAENRKEKKANKVPDRRVVASTILTVLLERDAFARCYGQARLDIWFDDVIKRLPHYYDQNGAEQVIGALRAEALKRQRKKAAHEEIIRRAEANEGW